MKIDFEVLPTEIRNYIEFIDDLYGPDSVEFEPIIDDYIFVAKNFSDFIKKRPFQIRKAITACSKYCNIKEFGIILINECIGGSEVLLYHLIQNGSLSIQDILEIKNFPINQAFFVYFPEAFPLSKLDPQVKMYMDLFPGHKSGDEILIDFITSHKEMIESLILNGFSLGSVGYCLKYDDIDGLRLHMEDPTFKLKNSVKWSEFEWSLMPENLSCLSVAAHFGSIKCFKTLLSSGEFELDQGVMDSVIVSGSIELVHMFPFDSFSKILGIAVKYMYFDLIDWIIQKGGNELNTHLCQVSNLRYLIYCLQNGMNVDISNTKGNFNLIKKASNNGYIHLVKYLASLGAKLWYNDKKVFRMTLPFRQYIMHL